MVAAQAWSLLATPEQREARKTAQAEPVQGSEDGPEPTALAEIAFFPLTLPFTTGPGTIAVAIALGAGRPDRGVDRIAYLAGASAASLVIALMVLLAYASADRLVERLGHARAGCSGGSPPSCSSASAPRSR